MENNITTEDKKAFKLFGIEAIIIILLIVVILVILSFLGVLPWRSFIPSGSKQPATITVFPQNIVKQGNPQYVQTVNPNLPKSISIVSDIPSVTVSITEKEKLISLLASWGAYGRIYDQNAYISGNMGSKPVEKIVIHLTNVLQKENRYSKDQGKKFYTSSFGEVTPGQLEVFIQIDPAESQEISNLILMQLANVIIKSTNPTSNAEEIKKVDGEITKSIQNAISSNNQYFNISL